MDYTRAFLSLLGTCLASVAALAATGFGVAVIVAATYYSLRLMGVLS